MSHLGSCDLCSLYYKQYGYNPSGSLGVESFWKSEERPKEERDIQEELDEDFPDYA